MTRTKPIALLLTLCALGCDDAAPTFSELDEGYRTAVGSGDPPQEEPALEPEHTCAPAWEEDDPENLQQEEPLPLNAGQVQFRLSMLETPSLLDPTADASLDFTTLQPAEVQHVVDGLRVPYRMAESNTVFDRFTSYLAQDEKVSEWILSDSHDGLSLDCETGYDLAEQHFFKICKKVLEKTLKAEFLGETPIRSDLGSTLKPKPESQLKASVKAYDLTVTYTYDFMGNVLSDPDFSIKPLDALTNLTELHHTGKLDTPVQYELSLLASDILPGCVSAVGRYTDRLDGSSDATFMIEWQFDF